MTRTTLLNLAAALASLVIGVGLSLAAGSSTPDPSARPTGITDLTGITIVTARGQRSLRDASGQLVPIARYERIASTSGVTDGILRELVEPTRIAAFTRYSAEGKPFGYRYAGKPLLLDIGRIEDLLVLKPDLVLVNRLGGLERIERLRAAGLRVFDLGEMRGLRTLLPNLRAIGALLDREPLARALAARFERRMRSIAGTVSDRDRPSALYLSIYGDQVYGAAAGTSHHDVLQAAGLRDVAADLYRDFPRYSPERLLALDPEVVVTHSEMARPLCKHPGLDRLRACGSSGLIIEVDGSLLDDPGLGMLDAAEAVHERLASR